VVVIAPGHTRQPTLAATPVISWRTTFGADGNVLLKATV